MRTLIAERTVCVMEKIKSVLRMWIPLAVAVTAVCGLTYLAVQQAERQSANDPQIQMAEDAAAALESGSAAESLAAPAAVPIERSLAPFVIVFDDSGKLVASSATLHGSAPVVPAGVFEYVRSRGEDRITWQPEPGVRIAAVIARAGGAHPGFVLAGRSLREVEIRESNAELISALAWAVTLAATLVVCVLCESAFSSKR